MSNPMRYIKDLEAAGFKRNQAEAQVQMVLDAIEGDLATKSELKLFQEKIENRITQFEQRMLSEFSQFQQQMQNQFAQFQQHMHHQMQTLIRESEFRMLTRIGIMMVSTASISVAVLTWLIKIK